ncbi:uncharacterized protein TRAVEDRAFT_74428 [Trametes versicolor FP-101664 SS1]|uniref:uncharacterized protein n=1 Tax=Trametes versicolor (strain FP-101664) TaxID=717944 RepID=UPI0004622CB2|nr:uncharacterized protein TRAVEDRAFT_74428 [Trametes versicolor FP-101664 SS1]EIW54305.1 hypothetical protein TRAVEDRAFT_74428 [Trametes versicolor FP-101664 SS1]
MSSSTLQPQHAASDVAADSDAITGSDPLAPQFDSTDCPRCHAPNSNEYHPENTDERSAGDIWVIEETPTTVVRRATRPGRSLHRGPRKHEGGGRPAVILKARARRPPNGAQRIRSTAMCSICLLATFGHEGDIAKLSRILQFFCLPVYPHHVLSECSRHPPHVHTSPEWCEHNAWLIAFAFDSSAAISGRWKNRGTQSRSPSQSSYRLDDEALGALLDVCEQKRAEWDALMGQDPGLAQKWFQEYQEDNARIGRERSASRASSTSASGLRRGAVRDDNTSTIPEVPPVPALPEGPAPSASASVSASAGDPAPHSPASSTSEGPVTLEPAHGLPNAIPRLDPGPSMEDVGTIAGLGNSAQPAGIAPVSAA